MRELVSLIPDEDWEILGKSAGISSPEEFERLTVGATVKTKNRKFRDATLYFREKYLYYPEDPVSASQWLNDMRYFGHIGAAMWPQLKEDFYTIVESNPRPIRVVLTGSIGWGKSFLSAVIMAFLMYELNCLRNPQKHYGLAPGTHITFMNLSVTATHAKRVLFDQMRDMMDRSPWFMSKARRHMKITSVIHFPRILVSFLPGSSSELAPLGENLFGGVIEEANFFPKTMGSKKIHNPAEREWDQAKKLHDAVWRRMKSRYQRRGKLPGMLILNSSSQYPDDFLERIAKENDPDTAVFHHAEWDTKPPSRYSGEKFKIFVGDAWHAPEKICSSLQEEELAKIGSIREVPIELESEFDKDIEGAIRDYMGLNIRSLDRFFTNDVAIESAVDAQLRIPFSPMYGEGISAPDLNFALDLRKLINPIINMKKGSPIPYLDPGAMRFCHIDLGLTNDACGIAVVHIAKNREVKRYSPTGEETMVVKEVVPEIVTDFVARVVAPASGEVQIEDIRTIIHDLSQVVGYRFGKITYDQFQSRDSQQLLKKRFGESVVGYLSVDRKSDQYNALKETIYEGRLKYYHYEPLIRELRQLIRDPKTGKVDHPPNGSKDCSDALAGAVWNALTNMEMSTRDQIQFSKPDEEDMKSKLERESVDWLLGRTKPKRDDEFSEEELMKEIELTDEDKKDLVRKSVASFKRGWK